MDADYCELGRASVFIDCRRDEHSAKILRRICGIYQQYLVTFDPRGVRPSSLVFWKALLMHMDADYCEMGRASVFIDFRRDEHSAKILRRICGIYQQYLVTYLLLIYYFQLYAHHILLSYSPAMTIQYKKYMGERLPSSHPLHELFCINPTGTVCLICGHHQANIWLHLKSNHSDTNDLPSILPRNTNQAIAGILKNVKGDPTLWKFGRPSCHSASHHYCITCDKCIVASRNASKHQHPTQKVQCIPMYGGKYYPEAPATVRATSSQLPSSLLNLDPGAPTTDFSLLIGPLPSILHFRSAFVNDVLKKVVPQSDRTSDWFKIFFILIAVAGSWENFEQQVTTAVEVMSSPHSKMLDDAALAKMGEAFKMMEEEYAGVDAVLTRNLKSILVKFDLAEHGLIDNPALWSFRMRQTLDKQVAAFKTLLLFLQWNEHPWLLECIQPLIDNSQMSAKEVYTSGCIPKLMYRLASEAPANGEVLSAYHCWVLCSSFETVAGQLRIRDAGQVSSFFATALYMLRESAAYSAAAMSAHPGVHPYSEDIVDMIQQVQYSQASQYIATYIGVLRAKQNAEAKKNPTIVDVEGNVRVGSVSFPHRRIRTAIPLTAKKMLLACEQIFAGDDWRKILNPSGTFEIGNESDAGWFTDGNVSYHSVDGNDSVLLSGQCGVIALCPFFLCHFS
jgi:hypothetical protein